VSEALECAKRLNAFGGTRDMSAKQVEEVEEESDEWQAVEAIFFAHSRSEYRPDTVKQPWSIRDYQVTKVERVQNIGHLTGLNTRTQVLRAALDKVGVNFEAGVHTRWLFHGAPHAAIRSIITDPVSGFKAVLSGTGTGDLWGKGIYFARDAAYSYYGTGSARFCYEEDGVFKIMLCLVLTGLSCAADERMKLRPYFQTEPALRYHSSVDSMSNPEMWVVSEGVDIYPAYVISFVKM